MPESGLPTIALVQMEVRPGLPDLNAARMVELIGAARDRGAEIAVFSELCISGYIIGDLWELDTLVQDFAGYSEDIRAASQGIASVCPSLKAVRTSGSRPKMKSCPNSNA